MFNKDNVFIAVNEEVSSIIQQYIIREIKNVLDKYKSITTEEITSIENLINSISNEELKEEFLNDWNMSVKIAKDIGENEVDDRIISMYQNLKGNGLEELSIGHVINWCNELDEQGYIMIDDYSIIYKSSANLKDVAKELLDELLDDAIYVDSLIDKDSLVEYWIEKTSKEDVIDDLIRGSNIEELLGLAPENIYEDEYNKYLYSEIEC
ncbi:MAG: hypothetical protein E7K85_15050 [Clostridium sp.]|uniref:hypothetical protein n=1 Tax=Clostridium TaxID=1485 RepID=UPI002330419B|nr:MULTISPECIES: hypothetical protein [Clostridium]MDB2121560.1 hypothetical protein [Clostridium paraputrificum]MDU4427851.1 hypothetical protein [Clostridium sp.]MDU7461923.1 hypothetical protein [Clostridium sp.]